MRRRTKKAPPKPVNPDNEWMDLVREECARAMVGALRELNTMRMIRTLTLDEVKVITEAVTARWIVMLSRRALDQKPYPDVCMTLY